MILFLESGHAEGERERDRERDREREKERKKERERERERERGERQAILERESNCRSEESDKAHSSVPTSNLDPL